MPSDGVVHVAAKGLERSVKIVVPVGHAAAVAAKRKSTEATPVVTSEEAATRFTVVWFVYAPGAVVSETDGARVSTVHEA